MIFARGLQESNTDHKDVVIEEVSSAGEEEQPPSANGHLGDHAETQPAAALSAVVKRKRVTADLGEGPPAQKKPHEAAGGSPLFPATLVVNSPEASQAPKNTALAEACPMSVPLLEEMQPATPQHDGQQPETQSQASFAMHSAGTFAASASLMALLENPSFLSELVRRINSVPAVSSESVRTPQIRTSIGSPLSGAPLYELKCFMAYDAHLLCL